MSDLSNLAPIQPADKFNNNQTETMKTALEQWNEYGFASCLALIDYEKLFDSIELWVVCKFLTNSKSFFPKMFTNSRRSI